MIVRAGELALEQGTIITNLHLLLAAAEDKSGIASASLTAARITAGQLKKAVERLVGRPVATSLQNPQEMIFAPSVKRAIEAAFLAARSLNQTTISSGHLFVGVLDDADLVSSLSSELGCDLSKLRADALGRLSSAGG